MAGTNNSQPAPLPPVVLIWQPPASSKGDGDGVPPVAVRVGVRIAVGVGVLLGTGVVVRVLVGVADGVSVADT